MKTKKGITKVLTNKKMEKGKKGKMENGKNGKRKNLSSKGRKWEYEFAEDIQRIYKSLNYF